MNKWLSHAGSKQATPAAVRPRQRAVVCRSQIGLLYTSCSGTTEKAAQSIYRSLGTACSPPINLQHGLPSCLQQYDAYIVGAPTYNTDASCQRTGTAWDDLLYNGTLQQLDIRVRMCMLAAAAARLAPSGGVVLQARAKHACMCMSQALHLVPCCCCASHLLHRV
jgi:hypothetical protein